LPEIKRAEPINNRSLGDWLKLLATIFFVVGLGVFAVNQVLEYRYNAVFLAGPCKLCADLNPEVQTCIDDLNSPRPSYPLKNGEWTDPFNKAVYNITIKK